MELSVRMELVKPMEKFHKIRSNDFYTKPDHQDLFEDYQDVNVPLSSFLKDPRVVRVENIYV